ncbi:MAG: putative signal-transduction protein containing cAMP-binding and domain [Nitrososphaeraceae archaeon]|jgi:CBS domain-containing protein|nr:putative signal-transduction protein containing cAMP-binding and domain [Nitrososphaeraceae archaeon]
MDELVRDIMTKDLLTISEKDTALKAAQLMSEKGVSSLIVLSDEQPIGIITERDFIKKVCLKELKLSNVKVGDMMSKIRTSASPDTSIDVAVQRMVNNRIRRLPIIENGNLVGIITVTDLAKHLRTILLLNRALSHHSSQ